LLIKIGQILLYKTWLDLFWYWF